MASVRPAQIVVGTTAVELTPTGVPNQAHDVLVKAPDAAKLWVGPAGVTASTGFPIDAGGVLSVQLGSGERLYGALASGSGTAYVLAVGVTE